MKAQPLLCHHRNVRQRLEPLARNHALRRPPARRCRRARLACRAPARANAAVRPRACADACRRLTELGMPGCRRVADSTAVTHVPHAACANPDVSATMHARDGRLHMREGAGINLGRLIPLIPRDCIGSVRRERPDGSSESESAEQSCRAWKPAQSVKRPGWRASGPRTGGQLSPNHAQRHAVPHGRGRGVAEQTWRG